MERTPTPHPPLEDGLVRLTAPDGATPATPRATRATALHDLVAGALADGSGPVYWLDARNAASTYGLAAALGPRHLADVQVARAFTAYQHHELVRRAARTVEDATLVVVPNVAALYRDDDVPDSETGPLFRTALRTLDALARSIGVPVVLTATGTDALAGAVGSAATQVVRCERTRCGLRVESGDYETLVYREPGWWQTTVPYWVDLLGAVDDGLTPPGQTAVEPIEVLG